MPRHLRLVAVLLATLVLACQAQAPATGGVAGGSGGPAGSPGASLAPASVGPAPAIPDASLTDPAEIARAIGDPARADVGIASAVAALGIGVYGPDNHAIRKGREATVDDMWLTADELLGLVEMDRQDLEAIAAKDPGAPTLGDLAGAIASVAPGSTADGILAAFRTAYASRPGVVGALVGGLDWTAATHATRATLWLLFVDAFVLPATAAGRSAPLAAAGGPELAPPPIAAAGLPQIPSQAGLQAAQFQLLLAHLMVVAFSIRLDLDPVTSTAHEGHGSTGSPQRFTARQAPTAPLASPFGGAPLLIPTGRLDGADVDWAASGPWDDHGTFSPARTTSIATDATGSAAIDYTPRKEPANGQGDLQTAVGTLRGRATVKSLVLSQFIVPPEALPFLMGERDTSPATVTLEWHEDTVLVFELDSTIEISKYNGLPMQGGSAHVETGANGIRLHRRADGKWFGTGTITGTTSSGGPACNSVAFTPASQDAYDWQVTVEQTGTGWRIGLDPGPNTELSSSGPDHFVAKYCPGGTLDGYVVAWENLWTIIHHDSYGPGGFGWADAAPSAQQSSWPKGTLLAEWKDLTYACADAADNANPAPSSPLGINPYEAFAKTNTCTETTTFSFGVPLQ